MLELLTATWALVSGLLLSLWGGILIVWTYALDVLVILHTELPRLEGLLVGVLLAWLLTRRDRHRLLRVVSAPLQLVLDILDLVWDQCVGVVVDLKDTVFGWCREGMNRVRGWISSAWNGLLNGLSTLKSKLSKSETE